MMNKAKIKLLSLSTKEKIKLLDRLVSKDFHSYIIIANLFASEDEEKGGLSINKLEIELSKSIKRKYYFNKKIKNENSNIIYN